MLSDIIKRLGSVFLESVSRVTTRILLDVVDTVEASHQLNLPLPNTENPKAGLTPLVVSPYVEEAAKRASAIKSSRKRSRG